MEKNTVSKCRTCQPSWREPITGGMTGCSNQFNEQRRFSLKWPQITQKPLTSHFASHLVTIFDTFLSFFKNIYFPILGSAELWPRAELCGTVLDTSWRYTLSYSCKAKKNCYFWHIVVGYVLYIYILLEKSIMHFREKTIFLGKVIKRKDGAN